MWCCSEGNFLSCHSRSDTILSGSRDLTSAINTRTTLDAHSHKLTTTLPHIISYFQSSPHTHTRTRTDTHTQRERERESERERHTTTAIKEPKSNYDPSDWSHKQQFSAYLIVLFPHMNHTRTPPHNF